MKKKNIKIFRRSIIVNKNIFKGNKIKKNDLNWVRPQEGLIPGDESKLIGNTAIKLIKKGKLIKLKDVKKN